MTWVTGMWRGFDRGLPLLTCLHFPFQSTASEWQEIARLTLCFRKWKEIQIQNLGIKRNLVSHRAAPAQTDHFTVFIPIVPSSHVRPSTPK